MLCDLTQLDYFLSRYEKSKVFKNNLQSIRDLQDETNNEPCSKKKIWEINGVPLLISCIRSELKIILNIAIFMNM